MATRAAPEDYVPRTTSMFNKKLSSSLSAYRTPSIASTDSNSSSHYPQRSTNNTYEQRNLELPSQNNYKVRADADPSRSRRCRGVLTFDIYDKTPCSAKYAMLSPEEASQDRVPLLDSEEPGKPFRCVYSLDWSPSTGNQYKKNKLSGE